MKIIKFLISLVICNLYRLLRFIPNNDPIMGVMLPYSKNSKWYTSALFAGLTMVSFDLITGMLGVWTIVTAVTYAGLGILFHFLYKNRRVNLKHYICSGILGVLIFDFITGPIMSSLMFGMSFMEAFIGQIPFTLWHLVSVTTFIVILVPSLDKHLINNLELEDSKILNRIGVKA